MESLKKTLLYILDFFRVLLVKIPRHIFMTKRGCWVLIAGLVAGVVLGGLVMYDKAYESYEVSYSTEMDGVIESQNLADRIVIVKEKADFSEAEVAASPQEFLASLTPEEPIYLVYYWENTERAGLDWDESTLNLFKVYYIQDGSERIIFKYSQGYSPGVEEVNTIFNYSQETVILERYSEGWQSGAILLWLFGGLGIIIGAIANGFRKEW